MSEVPELTHEESLKMAQERLKRLGGRWATTAVQVTSTIPHDAPTDRIINPSRRVTPEEAVNEQRLVALGMLAAGPRHEHIPYLAR